MSELSGRSAIPTEVSRRPWLRFEPDSGRDERIRRLACLDDASARQEAAFFAVLNSVNRLDVEGDTLLLLRGEVVVAPVVL